MSQALAYEAVPGDASAFRRLALTRLAPLKNAADVFAHAGPSDFDLNPEISREFVLGVPRRPAAVLVPIIAREPLTVLLTQRTQHLSAHAGQISFPGGKIDEADGGPIETALREAEEEIGLNRDLIEPLGLLDRYQTGTGFSIFPVVALVAPAFSLNLNAAEVDSAFEVPLTFLMDTANHRTDSREINGRSRHFHAMPFGEHYIWGATAGILKNMSQRLFAP